MNKEKTISQGPKNQYALHILEPGSVRGEDEKIELLFYGIFDQDKIMHGMDIRMRYPKWSIWSEEYQAENLVPKAINYFSDLFEGNDFITVPLKKVNQNSYVKVDGNRQITIYAKDSQEVAIKIEDLTYKLSSSSKHEK